MSQKCFLCGIEADYSNDLHRDIEYFNCPRCGSYGISMEAEADFKSLVNAKTKHIFSGIMRYRTENGYESATILLSNISYLKDEYYVPRNVSQKLDLLLRYIGKKSEYVGKVVEININLDYPITFSQNSNELLYILRQLVSQNLLEPQPGHIYILTVDGWNRIDKQLNDSVKKKQAFIAMWFKEELKEIYDNGFRKAIKDTEFEPMRIDLKQHNNKIDDEIIAEIKNSAFLVADFTGQRGGVYFEAGFAMGLGIPVIWTCKKDEINEVHFDTRQFNHITWENTDDLYTQLTNRIKATIN